MKKLFAVALIVLSTSACFRRAPKRASVESKTLNSAAESTLRSLQRALRLEVWASLEEVLAPDAYEGLDVIRRRVEATWKTQNVVTFNIVLSKLQKDKDGIYVAHVKWTRSVIGRDKQLKEQSGKSQVLLRREEEQGFRVLHVQGDPLY